jgi:hypothetical protein
MTSELAGPRSVGLLSTNRRVRVAVARMALLATVLLTAATGYLFAKQVASANPPAFRGYSAAGARRPTLCQRTYGPRPRLTFVVSGLNLQSDTVHLTLYLCLDEEAENRLYLSLRRDGKFKFQTPRQIQHEDVTGLAARMALSFLYQVPQEGHKPSPSTGTLPCQMPRTCIPGMALASAAWKCLCRALSPAIPWIATEGPPKSK